jgi:PAS domain S-box-containing protein
MLWAHVVPLLAFSLLRGCGLAESVGAVTPIVLAGVAASLPAAGRRARSVAVVLGLLTASAVLVHAWNGQIEGHFHFFVMIAVLALYEDWLPFGLAIAYVVAEHGTLGAISPHSVYNHGGNPWAWAAIHGGFVLGAVAASVATWRLNEDMRARMEEANRRHRATSERFRLAFETGVSGMALIAPDGRYLSVNRALCELTGYDEDELLASDFQTITHPDDVAANVDQHRALVDGTLETYGTEKRYVHRDGHEVWVQVGVTAVRGEQGALDYLIVQTHDVTERRRFADELAHRALHDPLTGLPNRALFVDRLRHALVRMRRHPSEVTSTASSSSTTAWATASATPSSSTRLAGWRRRSAPRTPSPASAATSSRSCARTPARRTLAPSSSGSSWRSPSRSSRAAASSTSARAWGCGSTTSRR